MGGGALSPFLSLQMNTILDQLATLEISLEALRAQHSGRSRAVKKLIDEIEEINNNMHRDPEASVALSPWLVFPFRRGCK